MNLESLTPSANFTSGAIEQNSFTGTPILLPFAWNNRQKGASQKKRTSIGVLGLPCTIWAGYRH
jgi:hypothetical protein